MQLREYQQDSFTKLRQSLRAGAKRPLLVAPTGSGKTVLSAAIIQAAIAKDSRVLFLAPRRELIYQATETLTRFGIDARIMMAGEPEQNLGMVQVASKDTLYVRGIKRQRMSLPPADLVIADEAHLSLSDSWKAVFNAYPRARLIGLTATPAGPAGRGLGEIYDDLVQSWSVKDLTDGGYLVPVKYFGPSAPDLANIGIRNGDYIEKDLDAAMDTPKLVGDIVENWLRIAGGRRTVVFCVTRKHGRHICDEFVNHGVDAEYVDGETPDEERKSIFKRVSSGKTQVLVNVLVATYGIDLPPLDCAVLARPTKNLALYLQCVGRILRPCPETGKKDAWVIDHSGAVELHGFVDDEFPWSLDGKESVQERREKIRKEKKEPKELKCPKCTTLFKSSRTCPNCGYQMIPKGEALPVYESDLQEIEREKSALNKQTDYADKAKFYAQLVWYSHHRGYKPGWAAVKYREKFSVWPNDKRVKELDPFPPTLEVRNWIKSRQIAYAKRRDAA